MSNIKHFPNVIIEVNGNDELFIDESTLYFLHLFTFQMPNYIL
jgi:hypothetical protein